MIETDFEVDAFVLSSRAAGVPRERVKREAMNGYHEAWSEGVGVVSDELSSEHFDRVWSSSLVPWRDVGKKVGMSDELCRLVDVIRGTDRVHFEISVQDELSRKIRGDERVGQERYRSVVEEEPTGRVLEYVDELS